MDPERLLFSSMIVRLIGVAGGLIIVVMAYKLFTNASAQSAGHAEMAWGKASFKIGPAVPGVFLAILGGVVTLTAMTSSISFEQQGDWVKMNAAAVPPDSLVDRFNAAMMAWPSACSTWVLRSDDSARGLQVICDSVAVGFPHDSIFRGPID